MIKYPTRRLRADDIETDRAVLEAVNDIPNYTPLNPDYSLKALQSARDKMDKHQQTEARTIRSLATDRDNAQMSEWDFHTLVLGVKDQIIAQFGPDSHEVQAIGLKKKSEHKRGGRRTRGSNNDE